MDIENTKKQMRKGVLEMCILAVVASRESYPGEIAKVMKERNLNIKEGTLYPLFTRLKNSGLIQYTWQESTSGPPRKYYSITEEGKTTLVELSKSWAQIVGLVDLTLNESAFFKVEEHEESEKPEANS